MAQFFWIRIITIPGYAVLHYSDPQLSSTDSMKIKIKNQMFFFNLVSNYATVNALAIVNTHCVRISLLCLALQCDKNITPICEHVQLCVF